MKIARILYPVETLGPGKRIGLWLAGCPHRCENCCNQELWEQSNSQELSLASVLSAIKAISLQGPVDGFVITGGDPFYQAQELSLLLPRLKEYTSDILVYTGYKYEQLISLSATWYRACLQNISVLIDGKYIDDLNDGLPLRGSSNQRIIYLDEGLQNKYEEYLNSLSSKEVQHFQASDGIISVGIHKKDFHRELSEKAKKRGVIICD